MPVEVTVTDTDTGASLTTTVNMDLATVLGDGIVVEGNLTASSQSSGN